MKWLPAVLLVCVLPVQSQPVVLNAFGEAQEQSQWCWAAVSAMAIRSFPADTQFRHLKQVEVYARSFEEVRTLKMEFSPLAPLTAQKVKDRIEGTVNFCKASPAECNDSRQPLLFDIVNDTLPAGKALSLNAIKLDIDGQPPGRGKGHPVVVQWQYRPAGCRTNNVRQNNAPAGAKPFAHALTITGYNLATKELRIFDPLPVRSPRNNLGLHERWIPFEAYVNPASHEGLAVVALHDRDLFRLRRVGQEHPVPRASYTTVDAPVTCPQQPDPGGFEPEGALAGDIDRYVKGRNGVFPRNDGSPRTGAITTGTPVAVIALGVDQLLDGSSLEPLLDRRANAYVVPVLEDGNIVDSFLLLPLNGGWQQGGYSNNQIARLLAELSERHRARLLDNEVFYLVSIPEMAAYFIAHGFRDKAMFLSLHHEGSGQFVKAKKAVSAAITEFRNAAAPPKPRVRPKPITSQ